jgi:hypothetical protein
VSVSFILSNIFALRRAIRGDMLELYTYSVEPYRLDFLLVNVELINTTEIRGRGELNL